MKTVERGTVFIEALIAAAIVAMALAVMLQSVVQSSRNARKLEDRRLALLVAQSRLATVGDLVALRPGQSAGSDGAFTWHIDVTPYEMDRRDDAVMLVSVIVGTGASPSLVTLRSLRASTAAATP